MSQTAFGIIFLLALLVGVILAVVPYLRQFIRRNACVRWPYRMFLIISTIGLLSCSSSIIWDGGFCEAEFEFQFVNRQGNPIEGIQLRVETPDGYSIHYYPVTDFGPDQSPKSDREGRLVFHHLNGSIEFSGRDWNLFFVIPIRDNSPQYVCRFLHQGHDVYRISYNELGHAAWESSETVNRRWDWKQWSAWKNVLDQTGYLREDWLHALPSFDVNRNGVWEREESVARGNVFNMLDRMTWGSKEHLDQVDDVQFRIVRRSVKLDVD